MIAKPTDVRIVDERGARSLVTRCPMCEREVRAPIGPRQPAVALEWDDVPHGSETCDARLLVEDDEST